jgi:hypothetical protein
MKPALRILFVENRYSTLLWEQAAAGLQQAGHEIHWMVQNRRFLPPGPRVALLPFPRRPLPPASLTPTLEAIARTDRAMRYFGVTPAHYPHYQAHIDAVLDRVAPDLVFGEATQFHELMTIASCKSRGIPFLAPGVTRYPVGRLAFWRDDSFDPVGGSGETLPESQANAMLDQIGQRSVRPSYMAPPQQGLRVKAMRMREQLRIARGWLEGERYITPSPWRRMALDRERTAAMQSWDRLAEERRTAPVFATLAREDWVLHPLQLQPESNIDVYGQPWNDQASTMVRAAKALAGSGARLVVKPNPKSKYEMCHALVEAARSQANILPLPHAFPMGEVFPKAPLVLSVTGTVILESIFAGKPVCVLGNHTMSRLPGVTRIAEPEAIAATLAQAHDGQARTATRAEAVDTLQHLHATSYDAMLWDPIAQPHLFQPEALERLRRAFVDVARQAWEARES